eukprot:TRINITY_DN20353_c0_g2_i3.p1 TRINITY_DN20353_c0_g2~~TRINITY_DN20353_c0_g2_i3.p1  ORF type:complete len:113 (+),score=12.26 TRINITY_DN20353_c0_g2_i3:31-339(+)
MSMKSLLAVIVLVSCVCTSLGGIKVPGLPIDLEDYPEMSYEICRIFPNSCFNRNFHVGVPKSPEALRKRGRTLGEQPFLFLRSTRGGVRSSNQQDFDTDDFN